MHLTRRQFAGASAAALYSAASKPNVMVIVLDDLGCRDLGYLGASDLKTPHIDALARGGARFENWHSNAPLCAPARASILTGRYPANAGVPTNGRELRPRVPTIASVLKPHGYRTAAIGKWHLGSSATSHPGARGFDSHYGFYGGCVDFFSHRFYWGEPYSVNYHDLWRGRTEIFEDGRYLTERITEETVSFIGQNRSEPFFAYVAYNAPHYPMHAPEQYMSRFPGLPLERRIYAAMIAAVDDGIGAIRKTLEQSGQFDNTLIFLLGDNGATTERRAGIDQQYATAGNNGVYKGFKFSLFDGGHHVPALASWPARFGGRGIAEPVMSMDILPTVCQAAGTPLPGGLDGAGILPLITGGSKPPHEYLFWTQDGQLAVRRGRWKLVLNGRLWDRRPDGHQPLAGEDAVWLSDLQEDPGETRNLRRKQPSIADELATAVEKWRRTLPGN